jgi:bacillithiol biosynthesis cysteine-adding enzyme BshC
LHKALTLLELADAIEATTGRSVAPVFWAATDDADFVEASHVSIVRHGKLESLTMREPAQTGRSMAMTELGDVHDELARLLDACGSAPDAAVVEAVSSAYAGDATVGGSYVALLRDLLEPLGIAVLDASHKAVRAAAHRTINSALLRSEEIASALRERTKAIANAGFHAQVADVPNLSLVFQTLADGSRQRIPVRRAAVSATAESTMLGPNVLLRPIVERQILPTVTYVGGPGEVAYFAQVSAVAEAIGAAVPRISPRWSGTLMESHVESTLEQLDATADDFIDPHAMESKVARESVSPVIRAAVDDLRATLEASSARMEADSQTSEALRRSIGTMRAGVEHRLGRLERRYAAAIKQAGSDALGDVAQVRATLRPNGLPQERVLSFVPFLARYGAATLDAIREQARLHADDVIRGG